MKGEKLGYCTRQLKPIAVVLCMQWAGGGCAMQVLQEVSAHSLLTEAKDFIAKCHFGIFLAIQAFAQKGIKNLRHS